MEWFQTEEFEKRNADIDGRIGGYLFTQAS
jgi:hypothetical protein